MYNKEVTKLPGFCSNCNPVYMYHVKYGLLAMLTSNWKKKQHCLCLLLLTTELSALIIKPNLIIRIMAWLSWNTKQCKPTMFDRLVCHIFPLLVWNNQKHHTNWTDHRGDYVHWEVHEILQWKSSYLRKGARNSVVKQFKHAHSSRCSNTLCFLW